MFELTKKQIERQDFVDNQIFELLQSLLPPSEKIDWDIEIIANVRDSIRIELVNERKLMSEKQFYPYLKI